MKGRIVGSVVALGAVLAAAPALAGKTVHFERSFPAANIEEVRIDVSFHDVRIVVTPGDTIGVTVDLKASSSGSRADKLLAAATPKLEVDDRVLEISAEEKHHHGWGSGNLSGRITVQIPSGRDLVIDTASGDCSIEGDLGSGGLEIDTASGDVDLSGTVGDAEIDTSSGKVRLEFRQLAGAVKVETASGDIVINGNLARLDAETASGDLRIAGSAKKVELDSSSGDVSLQLGQVSPGSLADIETASGGVRISVPAGTGIAGTVSTYSGNISSDLPARIGARGKELELTAANPALRVEINTSSGDVSLKTLKQ